MTRTRKSTAMSGENRGSSGWAWLGVLAMGCALLPLSIPGTAAAAAACPTEDATTVCATPGSFGYTVPQGVNRIRITVIGAGGAGELDGLGGGAGAGFVCSVGGLRAGTVLDVTVPAGGKQSAEHSTSGRANGGGFASVRSTADGVDVTASGGGGGRSYTDEDFPGGNLPDDDSAFQGGTATGGSPGTAPTCTATGPGLTATLGAVATSTAGHGASRYTGSTGGTIEPIGFAPQCPHLAGFGGEITGLDPFHILLPPDRDPRSGQDGCVVITPDVACEVTGDTTACVTPGITQYTVPAGKTSLAVTTIGAGAGGGRGGIGGTAARGLNESDGADAQGGAGGGAGAAITCTITGLPAGTVLDLTVPPGGDTGGFSGSSSGEGGSGGQAATAVYGPGGVSVLSPGGGGGGGGYTGRSLVPGLDGTSGSPDGQGGGTAGTGGTATQESAGGGPGTSPTCTATGDGLTATATVYPSTAGTASNARTPGTGGTIAAPAAVTTACGTNGTGGAGGGGGKGGAPNGGNTAGRSGSNSESGKSGCIVIVAS
ncbi:glycine-rich domain-containing protein [Nocardia colli]|uniref:glycine-rich domain-containing protein n=1 Tax=Nocardia colli TaxID=2545717 RepID=UPI0035D83019